MRIRLEVKGFRVKGLGLKVYVVGALYQQPAFFSSTGSGEGISDPVVQFWDWSLGFGISGQGSEG